MRYGCGCLFLCLLLVIGVGWIHTSGLHFANALFTFAVALLLAWLQKCSETAKPLPNRTVVVASASEARPGEDFRLEKDESFVIRVNEARPDNGRLLFEELRIVGITHGDREEKALEFIVGNARTLEIRPEPDNEDDPHALAVVGHWTDARGSRHSAQLGFVARDIAMQIARRHADAELLARLTTIFRPRPGMSAGFRFDLYKMEEPRPKPKPRGTRAKARKPAPEPEADGMPDDPPAPDLSPDAESVQSSALLDHRAPERASSLVQPEAPATPLRLSCIHWLGILVLGPLIALALVLKLLSFLPPSVPPAPSAPSSTTTPIPALSPVSKPSPIPPAARVRPATDFHPASRPIASASLLPEANDAQPAVSVAMQNDPEYQNAAIVAVFRILPAADNRTFTDKDLLARPNPKGQGCIVFQSGNLFRSLGRASKPLWLVLDGTVIALNGAAKEITPSAVSPYDVEDEGFWQRAGLENVMPAEAILETIYPD